jgi:Zn-dependent protease
MSTRTPEDEQRRIENLRAVLAGLRGETTAADPTRAKPAPAAAPKSHTTAGQKTLWGSLAAGAVFLLGKLKFLTLLGSVLKLKTLATMFLSIALYAVEWGWAFAAGFVLLILIHEAGHAVAMQREGIPASAPVFIPFVGAAIAMRGRPRNAYIEAKVAIAGPIAGSLAAWATLGAGLQFGQPLLVALGHAAVFLNLFNLVPVSPLDGGRIAGVFTVPFWIAGYAVGIAVTVATRSPILVLIMVVGLFTLWQRLRHPVPGYHDVPSGQRLAMGLGYAALVIALALTSNIGMPAPPAH